MLDNLEIMLNRYSFIRHSLFDVDILGGASEGILCPTDEVWSSSALSICVPGRPRL